MATDKKMFSDFDPLSRATWEKRMLKELKTSSLEGLQWHLGDSIKIGAFYQQEDVSVNDQVLGQNRKSNDWEIGELFLVEKVKATNEELLEALSCGINAPCFFWSEKTTNFQLEQLFDRVTSSYISTHFHSVEGQATLLADFYHLAKEKGNETAPLKGSINGDFLRDPQEAAASLQFAIKQLPAFQVLTIASAKDQQGPEQAAPCLADLLSRASDQLFLAQQAGIDASQTAPRLQFSLTIGTSYFVELAKIRALQQLWPLLLKGYAIDKAPPIHIAVAIDPNSQIEDQDLNMIRSTTQAMAAILGGATRLTLLPANAFTAPPTSFTRRMARNIQHILKMESYLDRVIDPAAGSYYLETLTQQLAVQAWKTFQKLEEIK